LLLTLLKLVDPTSGSITIDSRPLSGIPRDTLRTRIVTVTQDQFVLPGTIRENIDPFQEYSADSILEALRQVGLGDFVDAQKEGLDAKFEQDSLSHGQKQLFFVARAVLRRDKGRVVLLDEATSRYVYSTHATSPFDPVLCIYWLLMLTTS
jgi:ABC-type multidrug transport system fused ATPase/permease subunit